MSDDVKWEDLVESTRQQLKDQIGRRCAHFTGIGGPATRTCAAGVRYQDVTDYGAKLLARVPCVTFANAEPCTKTCDSRKIPTGAELDAEVEQFLKMLGLVE